MVIILILYFSTFGYFLLLDKHDVYEKPKRIIAYLLNLLLVLLIGIYLAMSILVILLFGMIVSIISTIPLIQGNGSSIIAVTAGLFMVTMIGLSFQIAPVPKREEGIKRRYNFVMGFVWVYLLVTYAISLFLILTDSFL